MAEVKKLKRAIIKEELVAITGDFIKATLLNQFIYWSERVKDFDKFIAQENKRAVEHGLTQQDLTDGWMYKTAEELSEETMLGLSVASIRTHIKALISMQYIQERSNPKYKWDRTKQYRVNLVEIVKALNEKGYSLEGYASKNAFLNFKNGIKETENHNLEIENQNFKNSNAIPEITTEITTETTIEKGKESKKESKSKYGTLNNVLLTHTEFEKLKNEYPNYEEAIDYLSEYIELKGYKVKSHYLALKKWVFDALKEQQLKKQELEQREARLNNTKQPVENKQEMSEADSLRSKGYNPGFCDWLESVTL